MAYYMMVALKKRDAEMFAESFGSGRPGRTISPGA
jgi:hypothetical protein